MTGQQKTELLKPIPEMVRWCVLLLLLLQGGESMADAGGLLWRDRFQDCFQHHPSLAVQLTHESIHSDGRVLMERTASLRLTPDGRFRLVYDGPPRTEIVNDGKQIRALDGDAMTEYRTTPGREPMVTTVIALFQQKEDPPDYRVLNTSGRRTVLEILPQENQPYVRRIVVTVLDQCPVLERILLEDHAAGHIRLTFSEFKDGGSVRKTDFRLVVPRNTRTITP